MCTHSARIKTSSRTILSKINMTAQLVTGNAGRNDTLRVDPWAVAALGGSSAPLFANKLLSGTAEVASATGRRSARSWDGAREAGILAVHCLRIAIDLTREGRRVQSRRHEGHGRRGLIGLGEKLGRERCAGQQHEDRQPKSCHGILPFNLPAGEGHRTILAYCAHFASANRRLVVRFLLGARLPSCAKTRVQRSPNPLCLHCLNWKPSVALKVAPHKAERNPSGLLSGLATPPGMAARSPVST
jgi:hypothetical protein